MKDSTAAAVAAAESSPSGAHDALKGTDIAKILTSKGPVVKAVLLKCGSNLDTDSKYLSEEDSKKPLVAHVQTPQSSTADGNETSHSQPSRVVLTDLIEQIEIDTTPSKSMVAKTLGGPFTFLGQYEDEGIVLMTRNLPQDLEEIIQIEKEDEDEEDGANDHDGKNEIKNDRQSLAQDLTRYFKVSELKALCLDREIDTDGMLEKADLVKALVQYQTKLPEYNPHQLQPPLHKARVRGDILCLRVAETEEELDVQEEDDDDDDDDEVEEEEEEAPLAAAVEQEEDENDKKEDNECNYDVDAKEVAKQSSSNDAKTQDDDDEEPTKKHDVKAEKEVVVLANEDFFLNYTKDEYIHFASRTDIAEHDIGEDDEEEGDDDDDDDDDEDDDEDEGLDGNGAAFIAGEDGDEIEDEDKSAMFNLVMNEVLRQYREENGRGPNTQELLELRASIAKELDVEVAEVVDGDWDKKVKKNTSPSEKKIAFESEDKVKEFVPDENEYNYSGEPDAMAIMNHENEEEEDDDDDDVEEEEEHLEPPAKRIKTTGEEEDSKPSATLRINNATSKGSDDWNKQGKIS